MISNKDLEKTWFLYKTEGQPKGMSTNEFCQIKGIPYREFEKLVIGRLLKEYRG